MKRRLIATVVAAAFAGACSTTAADSDRSLESAKGNAFYRERTIPSGTTLALKLTTAVASDTSRVDDRVSAQLVAPVTIDSLEVLPAGATFSGVVMNVDDARRVYGSAEIAIRFTSLSSGSQQYNVETARVTRIAAHTTREDAAKISGVVPATKGQEVRLEPGADVTTTLTVPLTVHIECRGVPLGTARSPCLD